MRLISVTIEGSKILIISKEKCKNILENNSMIGKYSISFIILIFCGKDKYLNVWHKACF